MITLFDYVYYRMTVLQEQWWHEEYPMPQISGLLALAALQVVSVIDLGVILAVAFGHEVIVRLFPIPAFFVLLVGTVAFNFFRYLRRRTFDMLEERWKDEDPRKRSARGVVILLWHIVAAAIVFSYGISGNMSGHETMLGR